MMIVEKLIESLCSSFHFGAITYYVKKVLSPFAPKEMLVTSLSLRTQTHSLRGSPPTVTFAMRPRRHVRKGSY